MQETRQNTDVGETGDQKKIETGAGEMRQERRSTGTCDDSYHVCAQKVHNGHFRNSRPAVKREPGRVSLSKRQLTPTCFRRQFSSVELMVNVGGVTSPPHLLFLCKLLDKILFMHEVGKLRNKDKK